MKLLDLQTGKYLELFKDYAYCGNAILFHGFDDNDCLPTFINGFENMINQDWACCAEICYKTEPQEPLKTLCEKTGAVVYGGRYVLLQFANNKTVGDVIKHNPKRTQFDQLPKIYHTNEEVYEILSKDVVLCEEMGYSSEYVDPDYHFKIIGNIFEEYSKQIRNEPNKFEELMERNGRLVVL